MACCFRNGKFALISNLVGLCLMGDKFMILEPEVTSVCPHSDGRPVHGTLVFCPETTPLRVSCRSVLPRHRDLTCTLTELEPTVYAKPFLVWFWSQQFCTSMFSVPDPVFRDLNQLRGEAPPHSASELVGSLVPDTMQHGQDS